MRVRMAVLTCFNCRHHVDHRCSKYDEAIDSETVAARNCESYAEIDFCAHEKKVGETYMQCVREVHNDERHFYAKYDEHTPRSNGS